MGSQAGARELLEPGTRGKGKEKKDEIEKKGVNETQIERGEIDGKIKVKTRVTGVD